MCIPKSSNNPTKKRGDPAITKLNAIEAPISAVRLSNNIARKHAMPPSLRVGLACAACTAAVSFLRCITAYSLGVNDARMSAAEKEIPQKGNFDMATAKKMSMRLVKISS